VKPIILERIGETIVVDGKPLRVKRILAISDLYIVVEHLDGRIEAIPISRLTTQQRAYRAVPV